MVKKSNYILFVFGLFLIASCKKELTTIVTRLHTPGNFNTIECHDSFEVYLIQDSTYSVKVEAAEKYIDKIEVELKDSIIHIRSNAKWTWLHPKYNKVKIYISCNKPKLVTMHEACLLKTVNPIISDEFGLVVGDKLNEAELELNCTTFYCWNAFPCGGKITLSGQVQNLKLWNDAIMTMDARNVICDYAWVENKSKGSIHVQANSKLEYGVFGPGDIHLYNHPLQMINLGVTSTGQLIQE